MENIIKGNDGEKEITRAIVEEFSAQFLDYIESDCIIIGAGPSGLMLAKEIASKGVKTLVIERNNYLGGGFWVGGYFMNKLTVREPAQELLQEIGVPLKKVSKGLWVADGPHACSKLIAAACDSGAKFLNLTQFDDLVLRENNRVAGVVINWSPVSALPRQITCVDPVALETKIVVDGTGHDAIVARKLEERGIIKMKGMGAMYVTESENAIIENTTEVHPGLIVIGMAVSTTFGLPRMGPTFASMLLSGQRGANIVLSKLDIEAYSTNLT